MDKMLFAQLGMLFEIIVDQDRMLIVWERILIFNVARFMLNKSFEKRFNGPSLFEKFQMQEKFLLRF